MAVKIFSQTISDYHTVDTKKVVTIQEEVNLFLEDYTGSVTWLQSSAANPYGFSTQLTAIVTYDTQKVS